jgi:ABC-type nickel/cobalt efflux system permease component RcnA
MSVKERSELKERVLKYLATIFIPFLGVSGIVWVLIALGILSFLGLSRFLNEAWLLTIVSHALYLTLGVGLLLDWWREVRLRTPA